MSSAPLKKLFDAAKILHDQLERIEVEMEFLIVKDHEDIYKKTWGARWADGFKFLYNNPEGLGINTNSDEYGSEITFYPWSDFDKTAREREALEQARKEAESARIRLEWAESSKKSELALLKRLKEKYPDAK